MQSDIHFDRADLAMFVRPAFPSDRGDIEALLTASGLPVAGAFEQECRNFFVATSGGELVGCVAVERYGDAGLLRSVAVRQDKRDLGIGRALMELAIQTSRSDPAKLQHLVLLTETAAKYFETFGFRAIQRSEAPESVKASDEFRSVCPASATTMVLDLR